MLRLPFALVLFAVSLPCAAAAQGLSWNPSLDVGVAYDTNVLSMAGDGQGDAFGTVVVDVPVDYRPSDRLGLGARYINASEAYQTYPELDDARARSQGQIRLDYAPRKHTRFLASGHYTETNRPGEVYEDAGLEFGRLRTTAYGGRVGLSQGVGASASLGLDYDYREAEFGSGEDQRHSAMASLLRRITQQTQLGASWSFTKLYSEAREHYEANVVMLAWQQGLSRSTSLSLSAGARFAHGHETQPEIDASLSWARASWRVSGRYAHTLAYTPLPSDLASRLGTIDRISVSASYNARRLRVALTPSYYWTRNDDQDARAWRGRAAITFMAVRWLGLNGSYSFSTQNVLVNDGVTSGTVDTTRHVGRVGIIVAPWNRRGAESLP